MILIRENLRASQFRLDRRIGQLSSPSGRLRKQGSQEKECLKFLILRSFNYN